MRVVVLGAGGLLGRHVVDELRGHDVVALARADCDVTDRADVVARVAGSELVINCAAFTNVDGAEAEPEGAYRVNALGAENAARAARLAGAKLVHVSTDFVFDGARPGGYDELDAPRPLSIYGRSKWAGEELVSRVGANTFLARVQGLYGVGGANFSSKLRALVAAGTPLVLDGEREVQPTWARAAARQIIALAAGDDYGTYHLSCRGQTTWAEFARAIAARLGVVASFRVVPTSELRAPAARPARSVFLHRMLDLRGINLMPTWESALDAYLAEATRMDR